jgi:hypothetical protein
VKNPGVGDLRADFDLMLKYVVQHFFVHCVEVGISVEPFRQGL